MEKKYKKGEFPPRQRKDSKTKTNGSLSRRMTKVQAADIAEESIKRADEYIEKKMGSAKDVVSELASEIAKIPKSVPVVIPEETKKKMQDLSDGSLLSLSRYEGAGVDKKSPFSGLVI